MIFSLLLTIRNIDFDSRGSKMIYSFCFQSRGNNCYWGKKLNHTGQIEERTTETQNGFINSSTNKRMLLGQG